MPKQYVKLAPLEVEPPIAKVLAEFSEMTGLSKSKIRKKILYEFFKPYLEDPDMMKRLHNLESLKVAEAAANIGVPDRAPKRGSESGEA